MKDLVLLALDSASAKGADYADVRGVTERREDIGLRNGAISTLNQNETSGVGVRVLKNGAWGFASSNNCDRTSIEALAAKAVKIAEASAAVIEAPVELAKEPAHQDFWASPCQIDPFKVSLDEKLGLLREIDAKLRSKPEIKVSTGTMRFWREDQWFASTDGALIHQIMHRSGAGYQAVAVGNGDSQRRSYPQSWGGNYKQMGYEILSHYDYLGNAERIRDEAIELLTAPKCESGKKTLILDGGQMALQIHESVGHANELDRVLGFEANYAGRSFMLPALKNDGGFRYGSDIVNLVADSTLPGGLATFGYDDDGVQAQRYHVVQDGMHKNWFTTRDTAPMIGESRSNAANRADGFRNIPITRIPNLSLMPGDSSLEQMISETEDGILMETNRSWSIDQMRLNFQFGAELGRVIKNGKIVGLCKNPTYQGMTPEFWGSCDAIGGPDEWDLWGVINCGKGQPGQTAEMTHGSAPTRFQNVTVGIA